MVGPLDLVLDQHPGTRTNVLAQNVRAERTNRLLLRFQLEFYSENLAEYGEIFFAREPRGEITRLAAPDVAQFDTGEPAKSPIVHFAVSVSRARVLVDPKGPRDSTGPYQDRGCRRDSR